MFQLKEALHPFAFAVLFPIALLLASCGSKETLYKDGEIKIFKVTSGNWLEGAYFDHLYITVNDLEPIELDHLARPVFKELTTPAVLRELRSDDRFIFLDSATEIKQLHSFLYVSPKHYSKDDFEIFVNTLRAKLTMVDSLLNNSPEFAHKRVRVCGAVYADFDENIKSYKKGLEATIKIFPDGRIFMFEGSGGVAMESAIGVAQSSGNVKVDSTAVKLTELAQFVDSNHQPFTQQFAVSYIGRIIFEEEQNVLWIEATGQIYLNIAGDSTVQIGYLDGSSLYKEGKGDTTVVLMKKNLIAAREKVIYTLNEKDAKFARLFNRVVVRKGD